MKHLPEPPIGSFEEAELFRLRMALTSTYAERLQDLEDMLDFNVEAEARNPNLRQAVQRLDESKTQLSGNVKRQL